MTAPPLTTSTMLDELEAIWNTPTGVMARSINWSEIGWPTLIDDSAASFAAETGELDENTLSALAALEPPPPAPWRRGAHAYQLAVADATETYRLLMAGRGSGKTYCAAHVLAEWIEAEPGDYAIVAPTFGDAVAICADGPSGFIKAAGDAVDRFNRNDYVIYMKNGSRVRLASADAPDRVRGWNFTGVWADELGSWRDTTVWYEGLEFATRIGSSRRLITTTPRRGNKILKELVARVRDNDPDLVLVRASTWDNAANLSPVALRNMEARYAGTTLGRQELEGELLSDVEGALITTDLIERTRVDAADVPELWRKATGVDPATTSNEGSDHTGIMVLGIGSAPRGWQPPVGRVVLAGLPHLYILGDYSLRATPAVCARRALEVSDEWSADVIVGEANQGGDYVETTVRQVAEAEDMYMPDFHKVWASVGKKARAEPFAGMWEQHRVHIVREISELGKGQGGTADFEDQCTGWVPTESKESPDRLDAGVWAAVELVPTLSPKGGTVVQMLSPAG